MLMGYQSITAREYVYRVYNDDKETRNEIETENKEKQNAERPEFVQPTDNEESSSENSKEREEEVEFESEEALPEELKVTIGQESTDTLRSEIAYPAPQVWNTVKVDGKLKMKGLPLSPGLKIYMERESLIDISVRAPLIGEAVRIIVTPDTLLAVNKIKKTYIQEGIGNYLKYYPGAIGDLQSLLLAKFFMPGFDLGEVELDELVDIVYNSGQYNVIPKGAARMEGIKYGYVVDDQFNPLMVMVFPENRPDIEIDAIYQYGLQGYDLNLVCTDQDKLYDATLEMKLPEWNAEAPKGIELGKKYRKVSINEFLRNFY